MRWDEEVLRVAQERFLSSEGHGVVAARSVGVANWRPEGEQSGSSSDVVLLDRTMPDLSGPLVYDR
jgi:hypothetical protein